MQNWPPLARDSVDQILNLGIVQATDERARTNFRARMLRMR